RIAMDEVDDECETDCRSADQVDREGADPPLLPGEPGHRKQSREEGHEHRGSVEQYELLVLAARCGSDRPCSEHEYHHTPIRCVVDVDVAQPRRQNAGAAAVGMPLMCKRF